MKYTNPITHLYKYFDLTGTVQTPTGPIDRFKILKDILIEKEIYIPSLDQLNDPFESLLSSQPTEQPHSNLGVLSFTMSYDNPLMWSHYSGGHSGIVIDFLVSKNQCDQFEKVQYIRTEEEIDFLKRELVKSFECSYENEYRRLFSTNGVKVKLRDLGLTIDSIIFGFKMDFAMRKEIEEICWAFDYKYTFIELGSDFKCYAIRPRSTEGYFFSDYEREFNENSYPRFNYDETTQNDIIEPYLESAYRSQKYQDFLDEEKRVKNKYRRSQERFP